MAIGNFFKNYSKATADQAGEGLVNLAVLLNSDAAAEAAIKQKQDEHNELVKQLVDATNEFKREKKEFDDIDGLYTKKVKAAERAQADLDTNPANKEAETALIELLDGIERIAPKLDKEKADFERADKWMTELQQASDNVAKELLGLRQQIDEVNASKKQAQLDIDQAKKDKERAEKIAGLSNATNKFDIALKALQKQADAKKDEATATRIVAEQLRIKPDVVSSAAAKYLDDVEPNGSTETLQERLARLKGK